MNTYLTYKNPVIRGFFPDPGICRADGIYYLVCSSFQYFPGIPLFESRDLINWTQIGHVLTRKEQLPLKGADNTGGIYAPTIRFHNGRFYVTATNVSGIGNFIVHTDDIHGEWSDPVPVDQDGIDPSLYFEGGDVYFMSNHGNPDGSASIMQCRIDPDTGRKLEESRPVWNGCGGRYLEGPHLYRINGWYYLLAAEGGTEYGHMEVLARGSSPDGPFENSPRIPIVSNRDLGGYPLQGTGHADLIEDAYGNWWMVLLAFRQTGQYLPFHHLGREVCLIPVHFTADGWMNAGTDGKVYLENHLSRPCECSCQYLPESYSFGSTTPGIEWVWLRNPDMSYYDFAGFDKPDPQLRLLTAPYTLSETTHSPAFLGMRQQEMEGDIRVAVKLSGPGEAGISLYMNPDAHYDFALLRENTGTKLILRRVVGDLTDIREHPLAPDASEAVLHIRADALKYTFHAETAGGSFSPGTAQTRYLSSEVCCGFTGVVIGLYAYGRTKEQAEFTGFSYCPVRP